MLLGLHEKYSFFPRTGRAVFYDLGSGFGKPCLAAALTLPFYLEKCIGIELLDGLYEKSLQLQKQYELRKAEGDPQLEFIKEDFMANTEWSEIADVVFANATCFSPEMVTQISKIMSERLKKGAVVIITTKTLEFEMGKFRALPLIRKSMSWGSASVYVYIKN